MSQIIPIESTTTCCDPGDSEERSRLSDHVIRTGSYDVVGRLNWNVPLRELLPRANTNANIGNIDVRAIGLYGQTGNRLDSAGISSVDELLSRNIRNLLSIPKIGKGSVWNVLIRLHYITSYCKDRDETVKTAEAFETQDPLETLPPSAATLLFDMAFAALSEYDRVTLIDAGVKSLAGPDSLCSASKTQHQALAAKIDGLLAAARETINALGRLDDLAEVQSDYTRRIFGRVQSPDTQVSRDCTWLRVRTSAILSAKPTWAKAYFERVNGRTLQDIGSMLGVTRERTRQIVEAAERAFAQRPGFVKEAIGHARAIVERFGGCIGSSELEAALWEMPWPDLPDSRNLFVSFLSRWPDWVAAGLQLTGSHVLILSQWDSVSSILKRVGIALARDAADDQPGPGLWSSPLERVLTEAAAIINAELYDGQPQIEISPCAFALAMADVNAPLKVERSRAYSPTYWTLRFDNLSQRVEAILRASHRAMHNSEIAEELQKWSMPEPGMEAALAMSPNILLWGRGIHIHRDCVTIDYPLLNRIAAWIDARLAAGKSFIPATSPFSEFSDECAASGIPNSRALYSLLKLVFSDRYRTLGYPYLASQSGELPSTPV